MGRVRVRPCRERDHDKPEANCLSEGIRRGWGTGDLCDLPCQGSRRFTAHPVRLRASCATCQGSRCMQDGLPACQKYLTSPASGPRISAWALSVGPGVAWPARSVSREGVECAKERVGVRVRVRAEWTDLLSLRERPCPRACVYATPDAYAIISLWRWRGGEGAAGPAGGGGLCAGLAGGRPGKARGRKGTRAKSWRRLGYRFRGRSAGRERGGRGWATMLSWKGESAAGPGIEACQIYLITSPSLRRRPAPSLPLPPSRRRVSRSPTSPPEPRSPSSVCPTNSNPCPNHTSSYLACPTTQLDNSSVPLTSKPTNDAIGLARRPQDPTAPPTALVSRRARAIHIRVPV